jgi:hypothetical protein
MCRRRFRLRLLACFLFGCGSVALWGQGFGPASDGPAAHEQRARRICGVGASAPPAGFRPAYPVCMVRLG